MYQPAAVVGGVGQQEDAHSIKKQKHEWQHRRDQSPGQSLEGFRCEHDRREDYREA